MEVMDNVVAKRRKPSTTVRILVCVCTRDIFSYCICEDFIVNDEPRINWHHVLEL